MKTKLWERIVVLLFVLGIVTTALFAPVWAQGTGWTDDFKNYAAGVYPDSVWTCTGNCSGITTDSLEPILQKSLKLVGLAGGCWSAAAVRPLGTTFPVSLDLLIRNGDEVLTGCHKYRGGVMFKPGPNWWDAPGITLLDFTESGEMEVNWDGTTHTFAGISLMTWHHIRVDILSVPTGDSLTATIWVDGTNLGQYTRKWENWMSNLSYLHLESGEGSVWIDNLSCKPSPQPCWRRPLAGDVDCEAPHVVDIADLTKLIDYLYISFSPLPQCW